MAYRYVCTVRMLTFRPADCANVPLAILELGAWFGTLYSGVMAERISRKYTILVNVCIFCLGVVVQCCARVGDDNYILGGRFVTGMGVGR